MTPLFCNTGLLFLGFHPDDPPVLRKSGNPGTQAWLLSCGMGLRLVRCLFAQQCPNNTGILVGHRHSTDIFSTPLVEFIDPPIPAILVFMCYPDYSASTMYQQGSQIVISPLADPQKGCCSSCGVLPGHQPEPGSQLTAILEYRNIK